MYKYHRAEQKDIPILVEYRLRMFRSIVDEKAYDWEELRRFEESWFSKALDDGRVAAWVAETEEGRIVAASAVSFYDLTPKPWNPSGRHAFVSSMYTEPDHRRQGLGSRLLQAALDYAKEKGVQDITLHASAAGRSLYESFGFKPTNEMRMIEDGNR